MSSIRHPSAPVASFVAMALLACGSNPDEPRPITKERRWQPVGSQPIAGVSPEERFGYEPKPAASGTDAKPTSGLAWDTPRGWRELPPRSMRLADFHVAGNERAECYLSILGGDGGGLLANVNRWRGQMSLPPTSEETLAAAPRVPFLGGEALLVDLSGTFVGMDGDQAGASYRMLGLIAVDAAGARFLKMTGPADVIAPEVEAFMDLAASFRFEGAARATQTAAAPPGERSAGGFTWKAPESWRRAGERPMREVTFLLGAEGEGECYVTLLSGTAGGAFANVNRWRTQMGQSELSAAEFALLQRIPMLGAEGVVVEADGTYRGMGDELIEEAALLGAVCELPGRAVFVKLIGPAPLVRDARADFLAFCQSLQGD